MKISRSAHRTRGKIATLIAVFALAFQPMHGLVANALSSPIKISSVTQLCDAIKNQADGQTWSIAPGQYGIGPSSCTDIPVVGGNTNKYMPLTANNLTISGVGNPTIYGSGYTPNGDGGFDGDFIAVTGDNVTIKNLTVMTKIYPNKAIEVRGANSTIENVHVRPNTLSTGDIDPNYYPEWSALWAGSIYYHNAAGNHSLKNSTVTNGGVSLYSANASFNLEGLKLINRTNNDFLNSYRVYKPHASTVITGVPTYVYEVSHSLNNIQSAIKSIGDPGTIDGNETIKLISDLWVDKQITINKPNVTIDGQKAAGGQYTIFGNFDKTDNANNSILGIQANGVRLNQLNINGQNRQLHGVNVYEATGVVLNDVSLRNNAHSGMIVGKDAGVTVDNITTSGNGWYGINIDKKDGTSSTLTVTGVSTHDEDSTAHIYIDDRTATGNIVNDPNKQYVRYWKNAGYQYLLDRSAPTVTSTIASENPTEFSVHATDDQRLIRIDYSIWNKDGTVQIGVWEQNIDGHVKDFNKTLTEYRVGTAGEYKPLTELPDGEYQLNVIVGDVRGKSTNATVAYFKVGDFAVPTVPTMSFIATPSNENIDNNGSTKDEKFKFNLSSSSDVARYQLKYWNDIARSSFKQSKPWNPTSLIGYQGGQGVNVYVDKFSQGEGKHYFSFSACNAAGNCSDYSEPFVVTYSTTTPITPDPTDPVSPVEPDPTNPVSPVNPNPSNPSTPSNGTDSGQGTNNSSEEVTTPTVINPRAITPLAQTFTPQNITQSADTATTDEVATTDSDTNNVASARTQSAETNEDGEVLAAEDNKQAWSLVNLLLTIGIVLASLVALSGLGRKENRRAAVRILSLVPAAGALVLLFAAENFTAPMGWVNTWSWLMAAIALAQIIILSMTRKSSDVE